MQARPPGARTRSTVAKNVGEQRLADRLDHLDRATFVNVPSTSRKSCSADLDAVGEPRVRDPRARELACAGESVMPVTRAPYSPPR